MATLRQKEKIWSLFKDTPTEQVQAVLKSGLLADLRDANIEQIDREEFRKVCGLKRPLLILLRTVRLSAQPATVTSEEFWKEAGVYSTGRNFEDQFNGLEVAATEKSKLTIHRLEQYSFDKPIMRELGDQKEISVNQFKAFLIANRGAKGSFLVYLKGKKGKLWAVFAFWGVDFGWFVRACALKLPRPWDRGYQVLSQIS
jgi:hypothetical protein